MSHSRENLESLKQTLISSDTGLEEFKKFLSECGTKDVERARNIVDKERRENTENLAMGAYPSSSYEVEVTRTETYTVQVGDPLSSYDIYQIYVELFKRNEQEKLQVLEKFMQDNNAVFSITEVKGIVYRSLISELKKSGGESELDSFIKFCEKNEKDILQNDYVADLIAKRRPTLLAGHQKIPLSALLAGIEKLRERDEGVEQKHSGALKSLEGNLLSRLKGSIIASANQYFKVNQGRWWSLHHQNYANTTSEFTREVNSSTTLGQFVEAIEKHIALENNLDPADAKSEDNIKVRKHSLGNFFLRTITSPENKRAYAIAFGMDEKNMPVFRENFSKKERGEALRQLGLLKSDEIILGLRPGRTWSE